MSNESKIVQVVTSRKPVSFRGALKSSDFNDFQSEVVSDLVSLSSAVNTVYSQFKKTITALSNDMIYLKNQIDYLRRNQLYAEEMAANFDFITSRLVDFSSTEGISFPGSDDSHSAMVNVAVGHITLPIVAVQNKMFLTSLRSGRIVQPPDLVVEVKSVFDKGDGSGLVDYEHGARVYPGKPKNAFNGNNQSVWVRRVELPLDSNITSVEIEVVITVPDSTSSLANVIDIDPFPYGSVDITELATSSSGSSAFTRVPTFTPVDNAVTSRWYFPVVNVNRIKLRLRQRNWVEEDGKKVFYYGLQELGLKLIEFDKTYKAGASLGENNSAIVKIDAPAGYVFRDLYRIDPKPDFLAEDAGSRHVHLKLSTDSTFNAVKWDSDQDIPPQSAATTLNINSAELYALIEMNWVDSTGGSLSPYPVGTTPYLEGIGLSYTLDKV